jgi:hypothetical protein
VTAQRARATFLSKQLQATAMFLLQITKKVIRDSIDVDQNDVVAVRQALVRVRTDDDVIVRWTHGVTTQYQHMADLIRLAAITQVRLTRMGDSVKVYGDGSVVNEPIGKLWQHIIQLMFERPSIMTEDDENGTHVAIVRSSLDDFVMQCVELTFASSLTSGMLTDHEMSTAASTTSIHDDDNEIMMTQLQNTQPEHQRVLQPTSTPVPVVRQPIRITL